MPLILTIDPNFQRNIQANVFVRLPCAKVMVGNTWAGMAISGGRTNSWDFWWKVARVELLMIWKVEWIYVCGFTPRIHGIGFYLPTCTIKIN